MVVTGLLGGTFATPVAMFPLKAMTIEGTLTGTLDEARELMALARAGKIAPPPIAERPLGERRPRSTICATGKVVGRVVLRQLCASTI